MKIIILLFFSLLLFGPKAEMTNTFMTSQEIQKDTVEFSLNQNFTGHCEGFCNIYIGGSNSIIEINGEKLKEGESAEIFVKCPTRIRLRKNIKYKFLTEKFKPDSCSFPVDSTFNTKRFRLIEQIK